MSLFSIYSEEEHRRIQERDKTKLTKQLAEAESKLTQAIQNTIIMLQSMGRDDSFICSKLCEIYQLSESDAMDYLKK